MIIFERDICTDSIPFSRIWMSLHVEKSQRLNCFSSVSCSRSYVRLFLSCPYNWLRLPRCLRSVQKIGTTSRLSLCEIRTTFRVPTLTTRAEHDPCQMLTCLPAYLLTCSVVRRLTVLYCTCIWAQSSGQGGVK